MTDSSNLNRAKAAKQDEFYTPLETIADELQHYDLSQFTGKTIYCNCDDYRWSNFYLYFKNNFAELKIKRLLATHYAPRFQQTCLWDDTNVYNQTAHLAEYDGTTESVTELCGDGDFRSPECLALLDEADIVVTNPPFSLFREYVDTLVRHGKQFIVLGSLNGVKYRDIFPLWQQELLTVSDRIDHCRFRVPDHYRCYSHQFRHENDANWITLGNCCWYTNLARRRGQHVVPTCHYTPEGYPQYDNYAAINVDSLDDIPCDYAGVMGVPITYMLRHNPEQYEVLGVDESQGRGLSHGLWQGGDPRPVVDGQRVYARVFICRR